MPLYPVRALERAMKISEVITRAISGKINWIQAAEILGMSDRQLRRWRGNWAKYGYNGLFDRRTQRPSPKRGRSSRPTGRSCGRRGAASGPNASSGGRRRSGAKSGWLMWSGSSATRRTGWRRLSGRLPRHWSLSGWAWNSDGRSRTGSWRGFVAGFSHESHGAAAARRCEGAPSQIGGASSA